MAVRSFRFPLFYATESLLHSFPDAALFLIFSLNFNTLSIYTNVLAKTVFFTAVKIQFKAIWVVMPRSVLVGYQRLLGPCCLYCNITLKM
jgi:hypothetical protein